MSETTPPAPISSGIPGLDQLLRGGLTPNRIYLIEGKPGTGKTTIAIQFLLEGRDRGERCLYVTLSETATELNAVAASHGWSLDGIELFQLPPPRRPTSTSNTRCITRPRSSSARRSRR